MGISKSIYHIGLLLYKNLLLQIRSPIASAITIILPVLFSALLVLLRSQVSDEVTAKPTIYKAFNVKTLVIQDGSSKKYLLYWPDNAITQSVMKSVEEVMSVKYTVDAIGYSDKEAMLNEMYENSAANSSLMAAVEFKNEFPDPSILPQELKIAIRPPNTRRSLVPTSGTDNERRAQNEWVTDYIFPRLSFSGPRSSNSSAASPPAYFEEGFLCIQNALNSAILKNRNINMSDVFSDIQMRRFPYPPYVNNIFFQILRTLLSLTFVIAMITPALTVVKSLVFEKETKLKESTKMMGLTGWVHWVAWYIHYLVIFTIIAILMTVALCIKYVDEGAILIHSQPVLVFLFFFVYSIQSIGCCFFLSTLFSKANTASVLTGLLWFFTYFPFLFINPSNPTNFYDVLTLEMKLIMCMVPNLALSLGLLNFIEWEIQGEGLTFSTMFEVYAPSEDLRFLVIFVMQIISAYVYVFLAWYVDAVWPGEFGVPQKFYFFLQPSYYGFQLFENEEDDNMSLYTKDQEVDKFEEDPQGLTAGIKIVNLSKKYSNGKLAVKGITLNMFENQITAFLGHNGAGKSSTISMLTGLYTPTGGTAIINGNNIRKDMFLIRKDLGICPQHDVLFSELTVSEHLYFYCKLKGMPAPKIPNEVDEIINDLKLNDKRNVKSRMLSGGMKRKLSVAIAFCAGSKIVLLDEPTSGMDPSARRLTWDVIQKYRKNRTILLTTHYMDEADLLGDRIAIMSSGKLKCVGTSMFLKRRYGAGYRLVMVKELDCDSEKVLSTIKANIPSAEVLSNVGSELSFTLPLESSKNFPKLFRNLDKSLANLKVSSYGISLTSLEEIFLKVGENEDENESEKPVKLEPVKSKKNGDNNPVLISVKKIPNWKEKSKGTETETKVEIFANNGKTEEIIISNDVERNTGLVLYFQQFYGLLVKRMINTKRSKLLTISQLIIPVICLTFALSIAKLRRGEIDAVALDVGDLNNYPSSYLIYRETSSQDNTFVTGLFNFAENYPGITDVNITSENSTMNFIIDVGKNQFHKYLINYIAGFDYDNAMKSALLWFNGAAYHTAPLAVQVFYNALTNSLLGANYSTIVENHPLPRTAEDLVNSTSSGVSGIEGFLIAICSAIGVSFLAGSFLLILVKERISKAKHIQFVSGVRPISFWMSSFVWDLINFSIPAIVMTLVLWLFQLDAWSGWNLPLFFMIVILCAFGILPMMYIISSLFDVPPAAFVRAALLNIFISIGTMLTIFILDATGTDNTLLINIFLIFPQFCFSMSLMEVFTNYTNRQLCIENERLCQFQSIEYQDNYLALDRPGIGKYVIGMVAQFFVYMIILICKEHGVFTFKLWFSVCKSRVTPHPKEELDSDVFAEQKRLFDAKEVKELCKTDKLLVKGLSKEYSSMLGSKKFLAVDGIYFSVPQAECFGLLGVNGAGKTTTFNMLTGDIGITAGSAYINGFNTETDLRKAQQCMGYCPQFDALLEVMTGKETLTLYARLRGVREKHIKKVVDELLTAMQIQSYANKECGTYSGGNKRKLSTAMSLIGSPSVIFLDEPSSGMDPVARRRLWDVLCKIREDGKSIVITSHSMEECEALSTRLAIMVNGQFKCMGTPQHVKSKFSSGVNLVVKIKNVNGSENSEKFKEFINSKFKDYKSNDEHATDTNAYFDYTLSTTKSWAELFELLESVKSKYNIEDYSLSQPTLEQIFLKFAKEQVADKRQD